MELDKIKEMLPDYIQGLLSRKDSALVKEQLEKSELLRREYKELRSYFEAINTLKPVKVPGNFLGSVHARIALQPPLVKFVKTVFEPFHIKIPLELAGVVLTTVLVIMIFNPFKKGTIPPVVFDESSMQAKKAIVDERMVEEPKVVREAEKSVEPVEVKEEEPVQPSVSTVKKDPIKKAVPSPKPPEEKQEERFAAKEDITPAPPSEATQGAGAEPAEAQTRDDLKDEYDQKIASLEGAKHGLSKPALVKEQDILEMEEEVYADKLIDRSDSIVLSKREIRPEPVDIGLLALSITRKPAPRAAMLELKRSGPESRKKRKMEREEKTAAEAPSEAAPDIAEAVQPESENDIIFAQVQSTIKTNKGKFTLLQDKPQKLDKRYYVIEISSENFPALRKALEKQGVVIEENFSFKEEESELIKFNLVVRIE